MHIGVQSELTDDQKMRICSIWNKVYPAGLVTSVPEFEQYLSRSSRHLHFLLTDNRSEIIGWAYTFDREEARWFSILLDQNIQGQGWGSALMERIKENESCLNGWVIDHDGEKLMSGADYRSPIQFYLRQGFRVLPEHRFENDHISAVKMVWNKSRP